MGGSRGAPPFAALAFSAGGADGIGQDLGTQGYMHEGQIARNCWAFELSQGESGAGSGVASCVSPAYRGVGLRPARPKVTRRSVQLSTSTQFATTRCRTLGGCVRVSLCCRANARSAGPSGVLSPVPPTRPWAGRAVVPKARQGQGMDAESPIPAGDRAPVPSRGCRARMESPWLSRLCADVV